MKWATRENAKVDRIACPWLISRFIDKEAVFEYLPGTTNWQDYQAKLGNSGFVYDVPNCLLGHHGDECSFDAMLKHFKVADSALQHMAMIVRSADTSNKTFANEGFGLEAIADGFRRISKNDFENQQLQFPVYDALYAHCQAKIQNEKN
jgi:hypothetical protein